MTFLELFHKIAEILAGENAEMLYDYILHSMDDDGGFLRTRWCYFEQTLKDFPNFDGIRIVLVALQSPFDFANNIEYYKKDEEQGVLLTELKMQISYSDLSDEKTFFDEAQWSAQLGYRYPVRIDLERGTAEFLEELPIFC